MRPNQGRAGADLRSRGLCWAAPRAPYTLPHSLQAAAPGPHPHQPGACRPQHRLGATAGVGMLLNRETEAQGKEAQLPACELCLSCCSAVGSIHCVRCDLGVGEP